MKDLWRPEPRTTKPAYGEVPLAMVRWSLGRQPWTCNQAAAGLDVGYRAAVRAANRLADLGLVVDVGKKAQATLWVSSLDWVQSE